MTTPLIMSGCVTTSDKPTTDSSSTNPTSEDHSSDDNSSSTSVTTTTTSSSTIENEALEFQTFYGSMTYSDFGATSKSACDALIVNKMLSKEGTVSMTVNPNGDNATGFFFYADSTLDSYYSLHVESYNGNKFVLTKHQNNEDTILGSCYISAGHSGTATINLKVIVNNGKIQCFYNDKLYISRIDDSPLSGKYVGLSTKNSGSVYEDITINKENNFKTVETLITGHSYMELWGNYKEDLSRFTDIYNIGIGGTSSPDWYGHIEEVVDYNPTNLIYMIGINDVGWKTAPSKFLSNVKSYVEPLLERLPNVKICLVSVNQCPLYKDSSSTIKEMNRLLWNYVGKTDRVCYADVDDAFLNADGTPDDSCFTDGLHPTANAYLTIRDAIYNAFDGINQPDGTGITYNLESGKTLVNQIQANASKSNWLFDENSVTLNSTGHYLTSEKYTNISVTLNFSNYNPSTDIAYNPFFSNKATKSFLFGGSNDANGKYSGYALNVSKDWVEILKLDGYTSTFVDGFNVDLDDFDFIFTIKDKVCSFSYSDGTEFFSLSHLGNKTIYLSDYVGGNLGLLRNDDFSTKINVLEFSYSESTIDETTSDEDSGKAFINELKSNASSSDWTFDDDKVTTNSVGHILSSTSYTNLSVTLSFDNYNPSTELSDNPFFSNKATKSFLFGGSNDANGKYSGYALNVSKDWVEILKLDGYTSTFVDGFNIDIQQTKFKLTINGTNCTLSYTDGTSFGNSWKNATVISLSDYTGGKVGILRNDTYATSISIYELKNN